MEETETEYTALTKLAVARLAELGLSDKFTIVNDEIIFDSDREQFLYELRGGKELYKSIYREHSGKQWEKIYTQMAKESNRFNLAAFKELYLQEWSNDSDV